MPGEGLALTAFTDIQLDIDGDAAWDSDLIDEKQSLPQSAGHGPQRPTTLRTPALSPSMKPWVSAHPAPIPTPLGMSQLHRW